MKLEAVVLPVADVDRAKQFYSMQAGASTRTSPPVRTSALSSSRRPARRLRSGLLHHAGTAARLPGPGPERGSYDSGASFNDPDGKVWLLQEIRAAPRALKATILAAPSGLACRPRS
jgi:hypothetical protein